MRPQQSSAPPFAGFGTARGLPLTVSRSGDRRAAYLEEDLLRDAGTFEQAYPHASVSVQGDWAAFTPDWNPAAEPPRYDMAFCIFQFDLTGFDRSPTVKFIWHTRPADIQDFWVGMGDVDQQTWIWYAGPADDVLTLDSFDPYIAPDGTALIAVVVLGQEAAILERLIIDEPELRGTGENELVIEPCPPTLDPGGPLPPAVDLASECPPVNDQGWWASCTAFAVGDAAFNFDLGTIYADLGWDFADPFNRISAKYLYIESGKDLGGGCPYDGRYTGGVVAWLAGSGVATEQHAPYDFSCNDDWSPDALADVPVLSAEDWFCMTAAGSDGLTNIKTVLANHHRPVIMRVNFDQAFLDYEAGEVWHYTGPVLGSHAMSIVGYDDDQDGGSGAFKVRNSWGPDWGDSGYLWISYDLASADDAEPWVWKLEDEYDALTAQRFCGEQATLEPPTKLQASQGAYLNWVRLNWIKSPGATGYNIYRDLQTNLVASLGDVDTWDDTTVANQLAHTYWIQAIAGPAESQLSAPDLGWLPYSPTIYQHSWGGSGDEDGRDVTVDDDLNVYLAGSTTSFGAGLGDVLLCKYNSFGVLQWARAWGGGSWDFATAVTTDGSDIYVAGATPSYGEGGLDFVLLKFNAAGTLQFQRTWGGSADDRAFGIALDAAGNIYLTGVSESFGPGDSTAVLLQFDSAGVLQLQATWGGSSWDSGQDLALDAENSIYIAGYTESYGAGGRDVMLLKYDSAGAFQWARAWGGGGNDQATAVALDGDELYLAGFTQSFAVGGDDLLLTHFDTAGTFMSAFTWGESAEDGAYGVGFDSEGNLFLAGQTTSVGAGDLDLLLLRLSGDVLAYQRTWGGTGRDWANRMEVDIYDRLNIAAGSVDATAQWQDVVGQVSTPAGATASPSGTPLTPVGVVNTPPGAVNSPTGTEDSGGGGDDALVLRLFP